MRTELTTHAETQINRVMARPKILILSRSPLHSDPRVLVQIEALRADYQLTCCGLSDPEIEGVEFVPYGVESPTLWQRVENRFWLDSLKLLRMYEKRFFRDYHVRQNLQRLHHRQFDLILCNDVTSLPLASKLKSRSQSKLYLDAHEYTPREFDADPRRKWFTQYWMQLLKKFGRDVDNMTTVCQSIADEYHKEFGLPCSKLVYNAPFAEPELAPSSVDPNRIRLVHHGGMNRNRRLESMIDMMDKLDDRFELEFMFVNNDPTYLKEFKTKASRNPRISFRDPVPTREISQAINRYDVGLFLLDPSNFNYRYALPNKFFEFIQARLAIAVWPSPEMKRIVDQHNLGIVADNFDVDSMVSKLRVIGGQEIMEFKKNAHVAANLYCAEESAKTIRLGVESLLIGSSANESQRNGNLG